MKKEYFFYGFGALLIFSTFTNFNVSDLYNFMAEPVWGQLEKAQDDNETIEKAIARLIAVHEADAGAHTESGESLETHKDQTIIDHKAGSVLADKESMSELIIKDPLKTITGWSTLGSPDPSDWPGCKLYVEYGAVNECHMYNVASMPSQFWDTDFDMLFQCSMESDLSGPEYVAWMGIALDDETPAQGFGFIYNYGVMKAVFKIPVGIVWSAAITVDVSDIHIYRAQYDASTGEATYYIDGVLKATLTKPTGSDSLDTAASIGVKVTETNEGNFIIGPVTIARGV